MSEFRALKNQIKDLKNPYSIKTYAKGFETARTKILGLVDDFIMREEIIDDTLYKDTRITNG